MCEVAGLSVFLMVNVVSTYIAVLANTTTEGAFSSSYNGRDCSGKQVLQTGVDAGLNIARSMLAVMASIGLERGWR